MKKNYWLVISAVIIALLSANLVVMLRSQPSAPAVAAAPVAQPAATQKTISLDELQKARADIVARLQVLKTMTQKEWDAEGEKLGDKAKLRAPTLKEAYVRNQKALEAIDKKIAEMQNSNK